MIKKNAMISITGRPNVGKSTLLNALVGEKIAIVTPKPQTTRNRILAVLNVDDSQFVFIDTPGYHKPQTRLGDYMVKVVKESVTSVDAVFLVVEPVPNVGAQEEALLLQIKGKNIPCVLIINKIDTVKKEDLLAVIAAYQDAHDFHLILPLSAKTGDGLDALMDTLADFAEEGPPLFPEGEVTDQPERQIMAEILREKILLNMDKEIPHGVAIEITKFSERENEIIDVEATIYTEKKSHKGMIIGKNGAMLKQIGASARRDMEEFMGTKVYLETWVKVKERWRDSDFLLRNFGYGGDK